MRRSILSTGVITLATLFALNQAVAQISNIEEIIITSQKREQSLQDVPVSVAVIQPELIERAQITDILDLQTSVSSLRVTQLQQSSATNILIRGFGNGANNVGIEGSVGIFIDGVYRNRTVSNILDFPDVERIEISRGPQSTLYGKNTSVGAISIITKEPEFEFGGTGEMTYGNYNQYIAKTSITGPIGSGENVAFRISGSYNNRDGYYKNNVLNTDINDRNRWATRGQLLVNASENLRFKLIGEYNKIDEVCCGASSIFNGPATQAIPLIGRAITPDLFSGGAEKDARVANNNRDPVQELESKGASLHIDYDAGFMDFASITSWRKQSEFANTDVDFTGGDFFTQIRDIEFKTFTQEVRFTSKGDDNTFDWLFGAFYMKDDADPCCRTIAWGQDTRLYADLITGNAITGLEQALGFPAGTFFPPGPAAFDNWSLKNDAWSFYGQIDFNISDRLTLTAGAAYLDDEKEAASNIIVPDAFSQLDLVQIGGGLIAQGAVIQSYAALGVDATNPAAIAALEAIRPGTLAAITAGAQAFGAANANNPALNPLLALQPLQPFRPQNIPTTNVPNANETGILTGDETTFNIRLKYDVSDNFNVYAAYATGWKAGAWNVSYDSTPPDLNGIGRTALPEETSVIELGFKYSGDRGFLNVAFFDQNVKNFQENLFTGSAFQLSNAEKETHKGVEFEALFLPFEELALSANLTYLDAKYTSYPNAPCEDFDVVNCGNRELFRDLSGTKVAAVHPLSYSVSGTYTSGITPDIEGFVRVEYFHESKTLLNTNVPEVFRGKDVGTRSVNQVNASLGLDFISGSMQAVAWVRNATDDSYYVSAFPTVLQNGSFSGYVNAPRTFGFTLRKQF